MVVRNTRRHRRLHGGGSKSKSRNSGSKSKSRKSGSIQVNGIRAILNKKAENERLAAILEADSEAIQRYQHAAKQRESNNAFAKKYANLNRRSALLQASVNSGVLLKKPTKRLRKQFPLNAPYDFKGNPLPPLPEEQQTELSNNRRQFLSKRLPHYVDPNTPP